MVAAVVVVIPWKRESVPSCDAVAFGRRGRGGEGVRDWGPFEGARLGDWLRAGGLTSGVGVLLASAMMVEWNTHIPDPACCAVESHERRPGDRFEVTRVLGFTLFRGEWKPEHEDG